MKILNEKEFKKVVNNEGVKIVDFFATWCGPCKMLSPVLDELDKEIGDKVEIIKIDIDENIDLAQEYGINTVPTVIFFKDNQEVERKIGFVPKDILKKDIENLI